MPSWISIVCASPSVYVISGYRCSYCTGSESISSPTPMVPVSTVDYTRLLLQRSYGGGESNHGCSPSHHSQTAAFLPKKLQFPTGTLQTPGSTLASFVGPVSWLAFTLLGIDHDWLDLPPAEWLHDPRYVEMGVIMEDLAVVNDTAERCIKDIQDFAIADRDGNHRGNCVCITWCQTPIISPEWDGGTIINSECTFVMKKMYRWINMDSCEADPYCYFEFY